MNSNRGLWRQNSNRHNDVLLRVAIGCLAIVLFPLCWGLAASHGDVVVHSSVSNYYHSFSRDLFEGVIFLVAVFMMTYMGHQVIDNLYTWVLGVLALGIASFPCALNPAARMSPEQFPHIGVFQLNQAVSDTVHLSCAVTFFILLAIYALVFFTKSGDGPRTPSKRRRNVIYVVCGVAMLVLLLIFPVLSWLYGPNFNDTMNVMAYIEGAALLFFGVAWIVKAGVVPGLRD